MLYDGIGVVIAWALSLVVGGGVVCLSYHKKHAIPFVELLPKASNTLLITCLSCILIILMMQHVIDLNVDPIVLNSTLVLFFTLVISIPLWLHPLRRRLLILVRNEFPFKSALLT
jgi:hypothetical protein